MTAIDDLVRASLQERARDITSVPPKLLDLDERKSGPSRRPWLIAAAAAVVVLAVVGMVVALRARDTTAPRPAAPASCDSPSGAAWRAALDRRIAHGPNILAGLANGAFVETDGNELALRTPSGAVTNLMVLPGGAQPSIDVDGTDFVVSIPGDRNAYVYSATGTPAAGSIELLPDASTVVLQDNRLYYPTTFHGGEVVQYRLGRDTTRVLYRGRDDFVIHDEGLRVRWHGGQVAARLPAAVRAALAGIDRRRIAYSGGSYEVGTTSGTKIVAADGSVSGPFPDRGGKHSLGVAGHYLLRQTNLSGHVHIYDTRTGAVLDTGMFGGVQTAGNRFALSDARGTRILDTSTLPELRC